jgi:asparaginyl-tRNA synthetase
MERSRIRSLLQSSIPLDNLLVKGWVRTRRDAKDFCFIELNDGSCLGNLQVIVQRHLPDFEKLARLGTGSALALMGDLVPSAGKGQRWDFLARQATLYGEAPETYPLQKKRHTDEYLRTIAHLRPRTNKYGAVFRIRAELSQAVHRFFHQRGFWYIHTPIITASDCEGAGELFGVTTSAPGCDPRTDFFGQPAHLTVSGQLSAEMFALAMGDVYTFGPTFRAENSNTRRHAAEFWMVEPEMAFCDLGDNMSLAEALISDTLNHALQQCTEDLALLDRFVSPGLLESLRRLATQTFIRLSYGEAVDLLQRSGKSFEHPVRFGLDLQAEHERFLTDEACRGPLIVFDYPRQIKPFYMRVNDDGETVAAMDVLIPGIGELVGGSQREERLAVLESRMAECGLSSQTYGWYLDSRRYGSVPHSGFGLGFERLLMLVSGVSNIRDVIPFPRTPRSIDF